ncbi:cleft lip and palate transmembrane protein 1 protein [Cystoisospora suis]|uniref:Cleft lip and palate transmembrane protein 1 protein n=1 Tax=Cystoisospora suis TaxID=483139 RepID=A0A2C6K407_9APIC|nr:cleft lip and palate transmembrane protein 1 protein [Cystoisospora suis]
MSIILAPCVLGYAVYALIHNKYKSWFSYIISVLAGSVYTFGFITMTPQLYINYKLKSVDHLPWRALVYRSLNTFVDDVASFLIDMPWMHRLSCFRDDIIFVCYLYQRWIYKVDKTRTPGNLPPSIVPTATGSTRSATSPQAIEGDHRATQQQQELSRRERQQGGDSEVSKEHDAKKKDSSSSISSSHTQGMEENEEKKKKTTQEETERDGVSVKEPSEVCHAPSSSHRDEGGEETHLAGSDENATTRRRKVASKSQVED